MTTPGNQILINNGASAWSATAYRVGVPVIMSILLFIGSVVFVALPPIETNLMRGKREMIKELTNSVWAILADYEQKAKSGDLTREEAQNTAKEIVRGIRYGQGDDYFWIVDTDVMSIMHPRRKSLEGTSMAGIIDPAGKHFIVEFVGVAKEKGAGYVDYIWYAKGDRSKRVPKISYAKLFEPWGWVIGTGIYIEDVSEETAAITNKLIKMYAVILAVIVILSISIIWQGGKIEKRRITAEEELQRHQRNLEDLVELRTSELKIAKERAESADMLKSTFLTTMSHELRTPLNSIIGFTGIILQGLSGPLTEEQNAQLVMVRNSADHLLNLINDVLDISKIEAGQLEITNAPFDLRRLVESAIQTVKPLADTKGLPIISEISSDVREIISDAKRVEQVLINLLNNAVKFTEKGDICINCYIRDENIVTDIVDTGVGISPEDQDNLFKPFHQLDSTISRHYEGTGLGLSICKKLVEILGGEISVESKYGEGSTFTFKLPFKTLEDS